MEDTTSRASSQQPADFWTCQRCTFAENPDQALCCLVCGNEKSERITSSSSSFLTGLANQVTSPEIDAWIRDGNFTILLQLALQDGDGNAHSTDNAYSIHKREAFWVIIQILQNHQNNDNNLLSEQFVANENLHQLLRIFRHTSPYKEYPLKALSALAVVTTLPYVSSRDILEKLKPDLKECTDYLCHACKEPVQVSDSISISVPELQAAGEMKLPSKAAKKAQNDVATLMEECNIQELCRWLSENSIQRQSSHDDIDGITQVLVTLYQLVEQDAACRQEMMSIKQDIPDESSLHSLLILVCSEGQYHSMLSQDPSVLAPPVKVLAAMIVCLLVSTIHNDNSPHPAKILFPFLGEIEECYTFLETLSFLGAVSVPTGVTISAPKLRYVAHAVRIRMDLPDGTKNDQSPTDAAGSDYASFLAKTIQTVRQHVEDGGLYPLVQLLRQRACLIQYPSLQLKILVDILQLVEKDAKNCVEALLDKEVRHEVIMNSLLSIFYAAPHYDRDIRTLVAMIVAHLLQQSFQLLSRADDVERQAIRDCVDYLVTCQESIKIYDQFHFIPLDDDAKPPANPPGVLLELSISQIVYSGERAREVVARGPVHLATVIDSTPAACVAATNTEAPIVVPAEIWSEENQNSNYATTCNNARLALADSSFDGIERNIQHLVSILINQNSDAEKQYDALVVLMNLAERDQKARQLIISLNSIEALCSIAIEQSVTPEMKTMASLTIAYVLRTLYPRTIAFTTGQRVAIKKSLNQLRESNVDVTIQGRKIAAPFCRYLSNQALHYFVLVDAQQMRQSKLMSFSAAVDSRQKNKRAGVASDIESALFHLGSEDSQDQLDAIVSLRRYAENDTVKKAMMENYAIAARLVDVVRSQDSSVSHQMKEMAAFAFASIAASLDDCILAHIKADIRDILYALESRSNASFEVQSEEDDTFVSEQEWHDGIATLKEIANLNDIKSECKGEGYNSSFTNRPTLQAQVSTRLLVHQSEVSKMYSKVSKRSGLKLEPTSYSYLDDYGAVGIITLNSLGFRCESKAWLWDELVGCQLVTDASSNVKLLASNSEEQRHFNMRHEDIAKILVDDVSDRLQIFRQTTSSKPSAASSSALKVPRPLDISNADRPEFLGVSVYHMKHHFLPSVESTPGLSGSSTFYDIENLSESSGFVRQKGCLTRCPIDGKLGAAYVHCLTGDDHVGFANHTLCWTWTYTVRDVVNSLDGYCDEHKLDPKRTYVWICCLCINQHRVAASNRSGIGNSSSTVNFETEFQQRVLGIGRVLVMMKPWMSPANLKRVWCIFEIFMAVSNHCELYIIMPPREKDKMIIEMFSSFGQNSQGSNSGRLSRGIDKLYKALNQVYLEHAEATVDSDRERILDLIRSRIGFDPVNLTVCDKLREWVRGVIDDLVEKRSKDHNVGESYCAFLKQVGDVYDMYGDPTAAHLMYEKILKIRQSGSSSLELAETYTDLGRTLFAQGLYEQSMESYVKALRIREKSLEKSHLETARTYFHVGQLLQEIGDVDEAMTMMQKCLAIQEQKLGVNHRETAVTYSHIGSLMGEGEGQNAKSQGLELAQRALRILDKLAGADHPETAVCYRCLAQLLFHQEDNASMGKNLSTAFSMAERCCVIQERVLGKKHPSLATTYSLMGEILQRQADFMSSMQRFRQALAIHEENYRCHKQKSDRQRSLMPKPRRTILAIARTYAQLSVTAHLTGGSQVELAKEFHAFALSMLDELESTIGVNLKNNSGKVDQTMVVIYSGMGEECFNNGKGAVAIRLFRQALDVMKSMLGENHPDLAAGHEAIGMALYSQGDSVGASLEYELSAQIRRQTALLQGMHTHNNGGVYGNNLQTPELTDGVTTHWLSQRRNNQSGR